VRIGFQVLGLLAASMLSTLTDGPTFAAVVKHLEVVCRAESRSGHALFAWLSSHQPAVLFSQNKPVISTFLSKQISTSQTNKLQHKYIVRKKGYHRYRNQQKAGR
jgi:hypothetical protein